MTDSIQDLSPPKIMDAGISKGGIKVTFDDGKSVVFSSSFVYEIYLEPQKLQEFQFVH